MAGIPSLPGDSVVYGPRTFYLDKDVSVITTDEAEFNFQGNVNLNGSPIYSYIQEKYDVRDAGAELDDITDDSAAFTAAAATVGAAGGGTVRVPVGIARLNSVVNVPSTRVIFEGDSQAGSQIHYYGNGSVFDFNNDGYSGIKKMRLWNTGGIGTKGIVLGHAAAYTSWKFQVEDIDIYGFLTAGIHGANIEQSLLKNIYVDGQSVCLNGFLIDNSRHSGGSNGINNEFELCRAYRCTSYGWDINFQTADTFRNCQSLSNAGLFQVRLGGVTYLCTITGFDLEDVVGGATKSGITISGLGHKVDVMAFSLLKGVEFSAAVGCMLLPSRFSTVTTPLTVGGTCTDIIVVDNGQLGSIVDGSAVGETHFIGQKSRANRYEISGTAGEGYIAFLNEQSVDPSAPAANGARMFTKDNGAGKTQLYMRFATGAIIAIPGAIEP